MIEAMSVNIPTDVRAAMTEIARKFGKQGGKKAAKNMTAEERVARAKKASQAAAKRRTEQRIARERAERGRTKG